MANLGYLQLTRNCYQKCQFCSNPPSGVHLSEEEMRGHIDDLVGMGYDGVILTGGEPSTSELLLPALAYARERKLFSRMITNGQKLANKDFFKECVDAGLTHIHVSLHSYRYAWAERAKSVGYPERFAQEALGHSSKAVHRAYAKRALVKIPSLEEYEKRSRQPAAIAA